MAEPAHQAPVPLHGVRPEDAEEEPPPIDPTAIERAYHVNRAKRRARIEHTRNTRQARRRYWVVLVSLFALIVVIAVTIWDEIRRVFGL